MRRAPPRITRLPLAALEPIAAAFVDRGIVAQRRSFSTLCDEAVAHLLAFHGGAEFDHESGQHHLAEAGAAIIQLLNFVYTETGEDDRPNPVRVDREEVARELSLSAPQHPSLNWDED